MSIVLEGIKVSPVNYKLVAYSLKTQKFLWLAEGKMKPKT